MLAYCLLTILKVVKPQRYLYYSEEVEKYNSGISAKEKSRVILEVFRNVVLYGVLPEEYFFFHFDKLSEIGKKAYITNRDRDRYLAEINAKEDWKIFMDKINTYNFFGRFYGRVVSVISNVGDKEKFIEFISVHKSIVVKPITSSRGEGVKLYNAENQNYEIMFDTLLSEYTEGFVVEEVIHQHRIMSALNESSVNTVRCPTILSGDKVHIFYPIIRIGRKGSFVDNGSAGGILASIDPETGIVFTKGRDELGNSFVLHPDSGHVIPGFKIPEWDELLKIVKDAAKIVSSTRYVGWDMAYTDNGWVIVEGNNYGQFSVLQIPYGNGIKNDFLNIVNDKRN